MIRKIANGKMGWGILVSVALLAAALLDAGRAAHAADGSAWGELTDAQRAQLNQGQLVTTTEAVAGSRWPRVRAYILVDATPEESAAVYWDFGRHHEFVPYVKDSQGTPAGPGALAVHYRVALPWPLPSFDYDVRNSIVHGGEPGVAGSYEVQWNMPRPGTVAISDGMARVEPRGAESLMSYTAYIVPSGGYANTVPTSLVSAVANKLLQAFHDRIIAERTTHPQQLADEVRQLHQSGAFF